MLLFGGSTGSNTTSVACDEIFEKKFLLKFREIAQLCSNLFRNDENV